MAQTQPRVQSNTAYRLTQSGTAPAPSPIKHGLQANTKDRARKEGEDLEVPPQLAHSGWEAFTTHAVSTAEGT